MVDCLPATGGGLAIPVIALALVLNAGHIMLGRIAEIAVDAPYEELVRTRFIEPLGLTHTYLDGEGSGQDAVNGFVLTCAGGEGAACAGKNGTVEAQEPSPQ